jgi:hypothetical protein
MENARDILKDEGVSPGFQHQAPELGHKIASIVRPSLGRRRWPLDIEALSAGTSIRRLMASIDPVRRFGERLTGRTSDDDKPVSSTQARPPPQVTSIDRTDVCFHHLAGVSPRVSPQRLARVRVVVNMEGHRDPGLRRSEPQPTSSGEDVDRSDCGHRSS